MPLEFWLFIIALTVVLPYLIVSRLRDGDGHDDEPNGVDW